MSEHVIRNPAGELVAVVFAPNPEEAVGPLPTGCGMLTEYGRKLLEDAKSFKVTVTKPLVPLLPQLMARCCGLEPTFQDHYERQLGPSISENLDTIRVDAHGAIFVGTQEVTMSRDAIAELTDKWIKEMLAEDDARTLAAGGFPEALDLILDRADEPIVVTHG